MRAIIKELALPGWEFTEWRDDIGQPTGRAVRVRAFNTKAAVEFHVVFPEYDDHAFTRDAAYRSLMLAVAHFIADPGAYYRSQYEMLRGK